jgi:predicted secreted protein
MKKVFIFSLVSILLLPLLVIGCKKIEPSPPDTKTPSKTVELTLDDFTAQNSIVKDLEIGISGSLTVKLGSNPSTGYNWGEPVTGPDICQLISHTYVAPEDTTLVGAAGTDVWVFKKMYHGTPTIKFSYGRAWEGGEKDTFTLTINATVK